MVLAVMIGRALMSLGMISIDYDCVAEHLAKSEIRRREGLKLDNYVCSSGYRTVGYGHVGIEDRIHSLTAEYYLEREYNYYSVMTELLIGHKNAGITLFLYGLSSKGIREFRRSDVLACILDGTDPWVYWRQWGISGASNETIERIRKREYDIYKINL